MKPTRERERQMEIGVCEGSRERKRDAAGVCKRLRKYSGWVPALF